MNTTEIIEKVKELSAVKAQLAKLTDRKKELEAYFLERGSADVTDTKYKSATYTDPESHAAVTYTEAQTLSIDMPEFISSALGPIFRDIFEAETKVVIKPKSKEIERMLIGIYTGAYITSTPDDVIAQLPCTDQQKKALAKKLKGASFETDRDNLKKIGGLSDEDANDYAYLFAEAVVWRTFSRILDASGAFKEELIRNINLAVSVSDSTKVTVT